MSTCFAFCCRVLSAAALTLVLANCAPQDLETAPVEVATPEGTVLCQLYTSNIVYWDRSIDRPGSMSTARADAICLEEGRKTKGAPRR